MGDELVGPAEAEEGGGDVLFLEGFEEGCTEAAGEDVVFEGDDEFGGVGVLE